MRGGVKSHGWKKKDLLHDLPGVKKDIIGATIIHYGGNIQQEASALRS